MKRFDARPVVEALTMMPPETSPRPDNGGPMTLHMDTPLGLDAVWEFEAALERQVGVSHAIAVSSGTAALHLALLALGVGPGDRVLVPTLSFVAAANAVIYCGAEPVFVDASAEHLGMAALEPSWLDGICAVIGIDLLGHPGGMTRLDDLCAAAGVPLIEDASQALGSTEYGRECGSFGRIATMSFNINKIVTTGGGGAVLTRDAGLATRVRDLSTQMRSPGDGFGYDYSGLGWNYRMPNVCAALALPQMAKFESTLLYYKSKAVHIAHALDGVPGVKVFNGQHCSDPNYWQNAVLIDGDVAVESREDLMSAFWAAGIPVRRLFTPMHALPHLARYERCSSLAVAEDIFNRTVCLI